VTIGIFRNSLATFAATDLRPFELKAT